MADPYKNQEPLVGIVLATYHCNLSYFEAQIESICNQEFDRWVCYISDDASPDATVLAMRKLIEGDRRFILQSHGQNLGAYHNFEQGLNYFQTNSAITHIAFSDQDDVWYPQKLGRLLESMDQQDAVMAHSDMSLIDANGKLLTSSAWQYEKRRPEKLDIPLLLLRNVVTGCTMMFKKELLSSVLPFPTQASDRDWYHDHWIALVAAHEGKIAHVTEPLLGYRQHGSNVVGALEGTGTIGQEVKLWLQKGRFTFKSYRIHRDLGTAFCQRFGSEQQQKFCNPFSEQRFDFGLSIAWLGLRSFLVGYGGQGITLRLVINKFVYDGIRLRRRLLKVFGLKPSLHDG